MSSYYRLSPGAHEKIKRPISRLKLAVDFVYDILAFATEAQAGVYVSPH